MDVWRGVHRLGDPYDATRAGAGEGEFGGASLLQVYRRGVTDGGGDISLAVSRSGTVGGGVRGERMGIAAEARTGEAAGTGSRAGMEDGGGEARKYSKSCSWKSSPSRFPRLRYAYT